MDFFADYRWKLIALTIVVMLGVSFLEDFKRDRGQHRVAKAIHAVFLTAYSLYALRYFEMFGRLRGLGLAFYTAVPDWTKLIQVLGLVAVVSGVFSAISAFMMRGRWDLARKVFMWLVLINGITNTVLAVYIFRRFGDPIWNSGIESFIVLWIPLAVAMVANVLYRLPMMRAFFGYKRQRVSGNDVIDDVVLESETDVQG